MKSCLDIHVGRLGAPRRWAFVIAIVGLSAGCDQTPPTAAPAPALSTSRAESPAIITREDGRLRIKLKKRQRSAIVARGAWQETSFDRGRTSSGRVAGASTALAGPFTDAEPLSNLAPADTAIVSVVGRAELAARSSSFVLTAHLDAAVLQGSWYPLQRAANGYELRLSVVTATGPQEVGTTRRCIVQTLISVPMQQCFQNYSMSDINGFSTETGTDVSVGPACAYTADLYTKGMVSWQHNFHTDVSLREMRERAVEDRASSAITRRCLPDPSEFCIDASLCTADTNDGGDAWIGEASVEGEVEWTFSSIDGGSTTEVVVCDVTDWYELISGQWIYVDTTIESCWVEQR
jgi:hypothetical protein